MYIYNISMFVCNKSKIGPKTTEYLLEVFFNCLIFRKANLQSDNLKFSYGTVVSYDFGAENRKINKIWK